ncbi:MAG: biosynthetic-type acetolactate synthase large subunit [Bacteroidaceae bacterium]|nr:biosynthetic-type acetolactate synthase large subunit [Bacteroidaceae bacterium]MBO5952457.1 biosynthetic-type acetolactate synthase large subunit [Bacteroidaceae bacterium]
MKKMIKGSEALMQALLHESVDTIFAYPGGTIMPVYDALYDHRSDLKQILVRHEQGATHAAQGYARVSGKTGVCIVTSGPGATNTITGISDAMLDSTPIVVIAGQVAVSALGTDAFQEIDLVGVTQPITKWSYQIRRAEDIAWAVARAFYIARSGRPGPVVLDFTKNAQTSMVDFKPENIDYIRSYVPDPDINMNEIEEAAHLINTATKPFALVGQGVELGKAHNELTTFLEKADIPAARTLLGLSALPTSHPLNMGMLGMHGNLAPNVQTNKCDLLIAIGMRFDDRVTGVLDKYAKQAKVIHLDIDKSEFNKNVKCDVTVLGDCKQTLAMITSRINKNSHTEWIKSFEPYKQEEYDKVIEPALFPTEGPLKMGEVVNAVSERAAHNAVLVTDVGQNQMFSSRYFKYNNPRSIITSGGLGTMGFGLPAAMGATFGAPERPIILFTGDGGLQMNIQELGTIMQSDIPVKIVLLNNNYLGNVRQWQELFFNRRYSCTVMANPDYMKIAEAYGINSRRVTEREELGEAINEMLNSKGAYILEIGCQNEENVWPMVALGCAVDEVRLG